MVLSREEVSRFLLRDRRASLTLLSSEVLGTRRCAEERYVWWPLGRPTGRRIGVVASRLGKRLDTQRDWFTVFRAVCSKVDLADEVLVTAAGATTHFYCERAAASFNVKPLVLHEPKQGEEPTTWMQRVSRLPAPHEDKTYPAFVSPPITSSPRNNDPTEIPVRDQLISDLSDRLVAIRVPTRWQHAATVAKAIGCARGCRRRVSIWHWEMG